LGCDSGTGRCRGWGTTSVTRKEWARSPWGQLLGTQRPLVAHWPPVPCLWVSVFIGLFLEFISSRGCSWEGLEKNNILGFDLGP
jgi:hypothetical protein